MPVITGLCFVTAAARFLRVLWNVWTDTFNQRGLGFSALVHFVPRRQLVMVEMLTLLHLTGSFGILPCASLNLEKMKKNMSRPSGSSGSLIGFMSWHAWLGCELHVLSAHDRGKYVLWDVLVIWEEQHATQLHVCGFCFLLNACFNLF